MSPSLRARAMAFFCRGSGLLRMTFWWSFVLLLASPVFGSGDLDDYARRVTLASNEIERIKTQPEYAKDGVDRIKSLLPVSEKIEADDQTVVADNAWLHQLLDKYENLPRSEERLASVEETGNRLRALEDQLERRRSEDVSAVEAGGAQREKLREILARSEFNEKGKDPIAELIKKVRRYILELIQDIWNRISGGQFGKSSEVGMVFRVAVILLLAGTLWLVVRMALRIRPVRKVKEKVTVLGEEIDAETTSGDLASAALAAASAGDFRTGVRKLYIALLYELSERGLIELEPQATNREYLRKVSRFNPLAGPMAYLTERFEYFWYGMFPSSNDDFSDYLRRYREAVASARTLSSG